MKVTLNFQWNINITMEPSNTCETLTSTSASLVVFFDALGWILQDGTSKDISEGHLEVLP